MSEENGGGQTLRIQIKGLDVLDRNFSRFKGEIKKYMRRAGKEAGEMVLNTEGLRKYPPATDANFPPPPYYIRGRGMETKRGNLENSEKLGASFYIESPSYWKTVIGNKVSYAMYVVGEEQARFMASKGWRRLLDVAAERIDDITRVFEQWVEKCIKDLGLN